MTSQSTIREQSTQQTVLQPMFQKMEIQSKTGNQAEMVSVNTLGYIDNGTGKHESNTVYGTDGISPCEYSVQHKEPLKVVVCERLT